MQDSVFTKIIKGEIPCHPVYEDDFVLSFMDINPVRPGHVLVVPKKQVDSLFDLDDRIYEHVMAAAKLVAKRVEQTVNPLRVGLFVEGFEVPHAHVHIIPLMDEKDFELHRVVQGKVEKQTAEEIAELAQKLRELA